MKDPPMMTTHLTMFLVSKRIGHSPYMPITAQDISLNSHCNRLSYFVIFWLCFEFEHLLSIFSRKGG
ncbi:MAG: hypothetical protein RL202_168 [Actinomycetota bacterium]